MADDDIIDPNEIESLLDDAASAAGASKSESPEPGSEAVSTEDADSTLDNAQGTTTTGPSAVASQAAAADAKTVARETGSRAAVANVGNDVELLIRQAEAAIASAKHPLQDAESVGATEFQLNELAGSPLSEDNATLDLLRDVDLDLRIELGRTDMLLEDVLRLRKGSVVALDKLAGDPVDVFVNGRLIARGEVLVLNDNFCVRVAELISGEEY